VAGAVAALTLTFVARSRWLIVHTTPAGVEADIASCARRLLLQVVSDDASCRVESGSLALLVHRRSLGALGTTLAFSQSHQDRRLTLFRSLLGKQYRTAVPLPAIRL
jgi:hypothetical protein